MRYFNKLLILVVCIGNINCSDLNKTEIFSKKTSESFKNIYKNDSPKSSPTLCNNITISQDDTNQATIINTINNTQDNITISNNQSTIINIQVNETNNVLNLNQSEQINNNIILFKSKNNIKLSKQRTFSSLGDFRNYYRLYPYNIAESSLCASLFSDWHQCFKKEVEQKENDFYIQCVEYVLSVNLLKTISYIGKIFNTMIYDSNELKYNPYAVKYINNQLVNMDVKNPNRYLFPQYHQFKYGKQFTDEISYILYKTFELLQYFLNSLDCKGNSLKLLKEKIKNNKNINKEQLTVIKQELSQQIKNHKDNLNKKNIDSGNITKKIDNYKRCYSYNEMMFNIIQEKINKYNNIKKNSNNEIEKEEANNKLSKYNNKKNEFVKKLNSIQEAINEYKNKLKKITKEIKVIRIEIAKIQGKYYDIKNLMIDPNVVAEKISNNLDQYFDKKEQLDNELKNIYNNNKLLNPLKLDIIEKDNSKNISNNIEEICNELNLQKNNINNYIEILKDLMKQLFKKEDKNKIKDTNA